jgi:hypothetical protein
VNENETQRVCAQIVRCGTQELLQIRHAVAGFRVNANAVPAVATTASDADSNPFGTRHVPFKMKSKSDLCFAEISVSDICQIGNWQCNRSVVGENRPATQDEDETRCGGGAHFNTESGIEKKFFVLGVQD